MSTKTDTPSSITRSATRFLSGTFLSRVTGMVRDMTMAYTFGVTSLVAAFFIAYRFSHMLRRLLGESPLSGSFIPHFEKLRLQSPEEGGKFFLEFFYSLALVLLAVLAGGELFLSALLPVFHGENLQILRWTMIMLPGLVFICLYGLTSSYLQCFRIYFLPGIAPAIFNLFWIGAALLSSRHESPLTFLATAIVVGFCAQWLFIWPKATGFIKEVVSLHAICLVKPFSKQVRQMIVPFALGIVGIAASQLNGVIDALFARFASAEGPAYLWYAIRIQQLPIAFVGVAYATALLPSLSRAVKSEETGRYRSLFSFAMTRSYTLTLSMMMVIFSMGLYGINMVYGRGAFTSEIAYKTTECLWAYSIGLVPMVFSILFVVAFQALREYKIPTRISIITVVINFLLNSLMVFGLGLGAISVALATSISSFVQVFLLWRAFSKYSYSLIDRPFMTHLAKVGSSTILSFLATIWVSHHFLGGDGFFSFMSHEIHLPRNFFVQLGELFSRMSIFVAFLFGFSLLLRIEQFRNAFSRK